MIAIDFPFRFHGGSIKLTSDPRRVVRAQLVDTLMTNYRERVMRPEYGADILSLLHHPSDELRRNDTARVIHERLTSSVPRAIIDSVTIHPYEDGAGTLTIRIAWRLNEWSPAEDLKVPIEVDTVSPYAQAVQE